MTITLNSKRTNNQKGQALIETIIGLSFVIIPLLLLLPYLSKVAGVQHRAEQASHYSAWERTVWKNTAPSRLPSRNGIYLAKKTEVDLTTQIPARFYGQNKVRINSESQQWDWKKDVHFLLKHQVDSDGKSVSLIKQEQNTTSSSSQNDPLGHGNHGGKIPDGGINRVIGTALGLFDFVGFSLERDQFYRTNISSKLENLHFEEFNNLDLDITSNSALLASGWNGAGPEHVKNRVERLVLTNYMNNGVIRTAQRIIGFLPFGKELKPRSLKLGHVEPDKLPSNRLCTYGTRSCGG